MNKKIVIVMLSGMVGGLSLSLLSSLVILHEITLYILAGAIVGVFIGQVIVWTVLLTLKKLGVQS